MHSTNAVSSVGRREFLIGFGAAVVALVPVRTGWQPRILMPIDMSWFFERPYYFTADYLGRAIQHIAKHVMGLGQLTPAEATAMVGIVEDAIWQIKPAGIRVMVSADWNRILAGQFTLLENPPDASGRPQWGTVEIVDLAPRAS